MKKNKKVKLNLDRNYKRRNQNKNFKKEKI